MNRKEKNAKKQDEIIMKVISMLSDLNFKEVTVRKICSTADISTGTFYHYFPTKNDLVTKILGKIDEYLTEQVLPELTSENEAENLIRFSHGFARYAVGIGSATGSIISTVDFPLPNTAEGIQQEHQRSLYSIPKQILQRGVEKEQFQKDLDLDETVDQLILILRGHSLEWARRGRIYDIEVKIDKFIRMFVKALQK